MSRGEASLLVQGQAGQSHSLLAGRGPRACLAVTFLGRFKASVSGTKPVSIFNIEHRRNRSLGRT